MFQSESDFADLVKIPFSLLVVDEFHKMKNEKGKLSTNMRRMRDANDCPVLGLTGTVMPNAHVELWNLMDIVAKGYLGEKRQFEECFVKPIKYGR